ncbi:hypothetical protein HYX08_05925 [Candidatus Woesearchaeota archaeon]|nr:hypothetical protein [Candidatus Woesearchaeota archaeon]
MSKSQVLEERIKLISGLHERWKIGEELQETKPSKRVEKLFEDSHLQEGVDSLAREQKTTVHKIKLGILKPLLSEIDNAGFLEPDVNYVDWCSGKSFLAYAIAHLAGAPVTRVDVRFPRSYLLERYFPCIRKYDIPFVKFDLATLRDKKPSPEILRADGKVAYLGLYCCGSLPDLIGRYAQLQSSLPDLFAVVPCHHGQMDFDMSTLASGIKLSEKLFTVLARAVGHMQQSDGYRPVARKAMEIIDYVRAENLKAMGYNARIVRLYHPNVSPFNNLLIGTRA